MLRAADRWLIGYLRALARRPRVRGLKHLLFCVADHFEPFYYYRDHDSRRMATVTRETALAGVNRWCETLPRAVKDFGDSTGVGPRHTLFYPSEQYDSEFIDRLAALCARGYGEIEVHLHHHMDTPENLRRTLVGFRDVLHRRHGILGCDKNGDIRYGFVHGNWALCNSRPDGRWCGVNEELGVLRETGCYADFTFPSAPSPTQPKMVNAIYYAQDTPGKPRSHDTGVPVGTPEARGQKTEDRGQRAEDGGGGSTADEHLHTPILPCSHISTLMLIQGPLGFNWDSRKWSLLPRLENADISADNVPSADRIDTWVKQHVHVLGRPEWVFVKVHTHGCMPRNMEVLLGADMRRAYEYLQSAYNDGEEWKLHYVTAREMFNIARAAEDGMTGSPSDYRDYEISPPQVKVTGKDD